MQRDLGMRDQSETLEECIGDLVEASTVEDLAQRCVGHLSRMLPSTAISFDLITQEGDEGETVDAIGVSDFFLTRYEQVGRRQDPVLQRAISRRAISDNATFQESEWCSLPIYRDVFGLHRLTNVLYAPVVLDGEVVATLDVGRGDGLGRFSDVELSMVQSFAAGVGATFASLSERRRLARESHNLRAALDSCEEAVVLTDSLAGSRQLNSAARTLLAQRREAEPSLDDLLRRGTKDWPIAVETPITLRDGTRTMLRCRSAPLADESDVIVSVLTLAEGGEGLPRVVEAGLTPRQREVARLTVLGLRDSEIAERLMLSPHTVKHHLKSIYSKLGVRSRVELANLAR
jgi:DNA-binding CsgD family transcriptional regulator/GAF domain-containing protein